MMITMRTTVDIPPGLHERITAYAKMRGESFSAAATDAMLRGMAPIETPSSAGIDGQTGLMAFNFGRGHLIGNAEVAELIDEDD